MPQQFLTVSEVARRMGAVPRDISDLSYAHKRSATTSVPSSAVVGSFQ